ncbi:type II secretion system protein [bacterium]|nr:type II secretion system protein [bacterium]
MLEYKIMEGKNLQEDNMIKNSSSRVDFSLPEKLDCHVHSVQLAMTKAFTLAEVLITLGIIGIVAAMTMPALITKHQKQVTVTRLKKAYSQLVEATKMAEIENGPTSDWNMDLPAETFMKTYVDPYVKFVNKDFGHTVNQRISYKHSNGQPVTEWILNGSTTEVRQFADGTIFFLDAWSSGNNISRGVAIDINGYKGPNILGKDVFSFSYNKETGFGHTKATFDSDRDVLLGKSLHQCNKEAPNGGHACSAVIIRDGWEIKDDYPW